MKKTVRPGTIPNYNGEPMNIFATIKLDDGKLSISGVEGPRANGDCAGGCGQIDMYLREPGGLDGFIPAPSWTLEAMRRFLDLWERWHLNDMRAGSPSQSDWLRVNPLEAVYPENHYDKTCEALAAAGLNPDASGYKYGSAWLREEVPADVIAELEALPEADKINPWRD